MATLALETARAFRPLLEPRRYKGAYGGRGSGKSHFFAELAIEDAITQPGMRILCVREVQRSLRESMRHLLAQKIRTMGVSSYFEVQETLIKTPGGGLMAFEGMQNHTADSVKSFEGFSRALIEEAHSLSQRSWDMLTPTIRAPGSEIHAAWNPSDPTDPVDNFFRNDPPDNAISVRVNWDQNPMFPADLKDDMLDMRRRDPEKAAHIWDGEYRGASEARIFRNYRTADLDDQVPHNAVWFYGADWGFSVDPTAALRFCFIDARTLYISDEVGEVGVPMERLPELLDGLPGARKWPLTADSARPETIDYVRRHGFPKVRPSIKGKGSIEDGITFLQSFDIVISPRCPNTKHEFDYYAYKRDRQTDEILPVPEDENNHRIDALRYAAERCHRKGKLVPGVVAEKQRAPRDYGPSVDDDVQGWRVA